MAACLALQSNSEYRFWLETYVRYLAQEGQELMLTLPVGAIVMVVQEVVMVVVVVEVVVVFVPGWRPAFTSWLRKVMD